VYHSVRMPDESVEATAIPEVRLQATQPVSLPRQALRFFLHLAAVYVIVWYSAPWLSGLIHDRVLPLLQSPSDVGSLQFFFSHVFAFTFVPGLLAGFLNAKYKHHVAVFVWTIPFVVLACRVITFPTSVFQDHFGTAFHYYFSSGFIIPEFHSYKELFSLITPNSDATRGIAQLHACGPFYAGVGYSLAALVSIRVKTSRSGL
jgi:hypothetical protein